MWAAATLAVALVAAFAEAAQEACPSASAGLAADDGSSGGAGEAFSLAQHHKQSLLAPRVGAQRAAASVLPPIGFIKSHKTGSSTMANILHRLAYNRNLSLVHPTEGGLISWDEVEKDVAPSHQFDMICNHQIYNLSATQAFLKPSPFLFTIARKPVDMTDSRFRFNTFMHGLVETEPVWEKRLAILSANKIFYANPLARDWGWYGGDARREAPKRSNPFYRDADHEAIEAFVDYIDRSMDLVMLTEFYDQGLVLLRRRLGLSMEDIVYVRLKSGIKDTQDAVAPPTSSQLERLKEFVGVDEAIYDRLARRFHSDWAAAGGEAALGAEVRELRARNRAVEAACWRQDHTLCPEWMLWDNVDFDSVLWNRTGVLNPQHFPKEWRANKSGLAPRLD